MSEYYKYIYDENEIRWFYDYCIPKLKQDEVFFFSLSARNKALNEKERELYQIGRNEMFNKMIVRHDSFEMLLRNLYRSETNKKAFLTNANICFPEKCLTLYWNINPTDVRKVIFEEQKLIMELQDELINSVLKKNAPAIESAFYKIRKLYDMTLSLYQTNTGTHYWLDFDIDAEKLLIKEQYENIHAFMIEKVGIENFVFIDTKSGMHILVRKKCLRFNPNEICENIKVILYGENANSTVIKGEIIRNKNEMIPLPGTLQCMHEVKVLNKNDFTNPASIKTDAE
jgi:hypothetical protein